MEQKEEEFCEEFRCCVCLDLLYKPVVLGCGHLSCFWCVHNAMNVWHESHCPICRHPYNHFPSICYLLHFLLLKMYPIAYTRREIQVREEENKVGHFSPQLDHHFVGSHPSEELAVPSNFLHSNTLPQTKLYCESCFCQEKDSSYVGDSPNATVHSEDNIEVMPSTSSRSPEENANTAIKKCNLIRKELDATQKQVSVSDLLCAKCKKLLFRPVILNCGHVYCESCVIVPMEGIPRCQICQSLHPNGFPSVCKVLENFLEEHFSEIYAERREGLLKQADCSTRAQPPAMSSSLISTTYMSWLSGNGPKLHIRVGCDSCGMSPIIGERYKCKDCVEKVGFDLCETCYRNPSKILGRFNQQHKPEHNLEIVQPASLSDIITNLGLEPSDDDGSDAPEEQDYVSFAPMFLVDAPEDVEDGSSDVDDVSPILVSVDVAPDQESDWDAHDLSHLTGQD